MPSEQRRDLKLIPFEGDKPPASVESKYSNYFKVGHNAFEFVLEFSQLYSEPSAEVVHTRIVTSPVYAKELLGVLQEAVDTYERTFGAIPKNE